MGIERAALAGALAVGAVMGAGGASANPIRAIYGGALYHDLPVSSDGSVEEGPNLQAEIQFESPGFFRYVLDPSIYVMGSVSTRGDTSFGGFGFNWKFHVTPKWAIEPGIGYVVHDGELDLPFPLGDPRNRAFADENILFGSRDLFRLSVGLTRDFGTHWSGQLYYEHLSHGQIIGDGRNQGLDSIGLRAAYRFRARDGSKL